MMQLGKERLLVFSGVKEERREVAGEGCLLHKKLQKQIHSWKAWSERLLPTELREKVRKQYNDHCC